MSENAMRTFLQKLGHCMYQGIVKTISLRHLHGLRRSKFISKNKIFKQTNNMIQSITKSHQRK